MIYLEGKKKRFLISYLNKLDKAAVKVILKQTKVILEYLESCNLKGKGKIETGTHLKTLIIDGLLNIAPKSNRTFFPLK